MAQLFDKNSRDVTKLELTLVTSDHAYGPHIEITTKLNKAALIFTAEEIKGLKYWCEKVLAKIEEIGCYSVDVG